MAKPTLVCVDDEKIVLVSLKDQLRRHFTDDLAIETVESGEEALELVEELLEEGLDVPVLVSDHIMPGMKGTELLVRVHERSPKTLKILLTGQADADAVGEAVNSANLYRYITKPWSEDDLVLTLREAARSYFQDKALEEKNCELHILNAELAKQQETLMRLVAGIVHELNTPLGAIRSSSQTASRALREADPDAPISTQRGALGLFDVMQQGSARISSLVERLKGFVSLDQAERRVVDIRSCVDDVVALMQSTLPDGISVAHEIGEQALEADCYPARLTHVLLQLVDNAAAASNPEGRIEITVGEDAGFARIVVADDGHGIESQRLERIFEPEFTTNSQGGRVQLGLGLATAKRIVEEVGGRVRIESEIGSGTRVIVELPLA